MNRKDRIAIVISNQDEAPVVALVKSSEKEEA